MGNNFQMIAYIGNIFENMLIEDRKTSKTKNHKIVPKLQKLFYYNREDLTIVAIVL